ncbi:hypothetical protein B0H14DRAFT_3773478 [Mycena olivaceomarginata]|nr:hypothetical protein B0H14DRAFT_3773478 [Mycena olivaceomarginata]
MPKRSGVQGIWVLWGRPSPNTPTELADQPGTAELPAVAASVQPDTALGLGLLVMSGWPAHPTGAAAAPARAPALRLSAAQTAAAVAGSSGRRSGNARFRGGGRAHITGVRWGAPPVLASTVLPLATVPARADPSSGGAVGMTPPPSLSSPSLDVSSPSDVSMTQTQTHTTLSACAHTGDVADSEDDVVDDMGEDVRGNVGWRAGSGRCWWNATGSARGLCTCRGKFSLEYTCCQLSVDVCGRWCCPNGYCTTNEDDACRDTGHSGGSGLQVEVNVDVPEEPDTAGGAYVNGDLRWKAQLVAGRPYRKCKGEGNSVPHRPLYFGLTGYLGNVSGLLSNPSREILCSAGETGGDPHGPHFTLAAGPTAWGVCSAQEPAAHRQRINWSKRNNRKG